MTTLEAIFAGAVGTLVGGLIVYFVTLGLQKSLSREQLSFHQKLMDQQLEFFKRQAVADAEFRRQLHDEGRAAFTEFRDMMNSRLAYLPSRLASHLPDRGSGSEPAS